MTRKHVANTLVRPSLKAKPSRLNAAITVRTLSPRRGGFTLVEAMISITLLALSASVLLLAMETSLQTTQDSVERSIASGLAEQLMDEILGSRYMAIGETPDKFPLGPSAWEQEGVGRERYGETGAFNGYVAQGAVDLWGVPLGQGDGQGGLRHTNFRSRDAAFANWVQKVEIYYVDETNPSVRLADGLVSNYRAAEVRIGRIVEEGYFLELAKIRRVFAYVPSPQ